MFCQCLYFSPVIQIPDFGLFRCQTMRGKKKCYFKSLSLWQFVTAATRNRCRLSYPSNAISLHPWRTLEYLTIFICTMPPTIILGGFTIHAHNPSNISNSTHLHLNSNGHLFHHSSVLYHYRHALNHVISKTNYMLSDDQVLFSQLCFQT